MKKTLAFDIDGTLLNKQGQLFPEVKPFFLHPSFLVGSNLVFSTGSSIKVARAIEERIKELSPTLKSLKSYKSTCDGALIYSPSWEKISSSPIKKATVKKLAKLVLKMQPGCDFIVITHDNNLIAEPENKSRRKDFEKLKRQEDAKGAVGMNLVFGGSLDDILKKANEVLGFCVFPSKDMDELYEPLVNFSQKEKLKFNFINHPAQMFQFSASSKWDALEFITEFENKHKLLGDFVKNPQDIIYFGDDPNDIKCLEKCNISFARGKNLSDKVIKAAKFYVDDLTETAAKLFE